MTNPTAGANERMPDTTPLSPWRSRVGKRLLLLFFAVALIPVALLGGVAGQALEAAAERMDRQLLDHAVRRVGMQVLDRLVSAKELMGTWPVDPRVLLAIPPSSPAGPLLSAAAASSPQAGPATAATAASATAARALSGFGSVFREAALLADDGTVVWYAHTSDPSSPADPQGASALLERWQAAASQAEATAAAAAGPKRPDVSAPIMNANTRVRLRSVPQAAQASSVTQVMLGREQDGHLRWVAVLAAERLWAPVVENAADAAWRVVDTQGQLLMTAGQDPSLAGDPVRRAQWGLFLRAELGAGDWTLQQVRPVTDTRIAGLPWRYWLVLMGLAILGLVALLSLVQIRRTLVPLGQLTEGTRRLAGGDTAVRIPCDAPDEFGDLARGFNHMAVRIDEQVQSLQMLATIDRDILRRAPPEEVGERILSGFVAAHPGAQAVIAWVDETPAPMLQTLYCAPGHPAAVPLPPTLLTPEEFAAFRAQHADLAMRRETVPDHLAPPWVSPILQEGVRQLAVFCVPFAAALSAEAKGRSSAAVSAQRNRAVLCVGLPRERTQVLRSVLRQAEEFRDRLAVAYAARERDDLLLYRALHDSLTGLTNRQGLNEFVDALLVADPHTERAVLFIDLDRFKTINDTLGHAAGDELLCEAARRLLALAPPGAVVARPGGDEFVMLMPQADEQGAREMARMLCERLAQPFQLRGAQHVLGASVGIALAPAHGLLREDLLRHADMAMYAAKQGGRGRYQVYSEPMDAQARDRLELMAELRGAIERRELQAWFQPRVRPVDGRIVSAESLVRWQHPTRGLVMPSAFIALAEETDLIEGIGLFMLDATCAQIAQWRRDGLGLERVSVNVSPRQLASGRLLDQVRSALDHHQVPPQFLEIEVTESLLVDDAQAAIDQLSELRRWGVTIALDDFGTGYSSMATLRNLPIDVMKVDRAFVKDLGRDGGALAVTRAILSLAKTLGHHVVAEGIETEAQAQLLAEMGCDELQGFLYSRAVRAADFARLTRLAPTPA